MGMAEREFSLKGKFIVTLSTISKVMLCRYFGRLQTNVRCMSGYK